MVKPDSRYASEVQRGAQNVLRQLLMVSASHDYIVGLGLLQQTTTADRAAIDQCIEILTAAQTDDECAEAFRLAGSILHTGEQPRPLH
jgi:hypothetical protein